MADCTTTRLRLASARRKVAAFLDQIRHLEASDFPHPDARQALELMRDQYTRRLRALSRLSSSVAIDIVEGMCIQTSVALAKETEVLGFILRSTNVRNAFEIHFPLKRLVRKVVSPEAQLILSSEWNFVPFTYPMNLDILPSFVLIGAPATESGNVLTTPLAGHEIGHSVWRVPGMRKKALEAATFALVEAMDAHPERRDRILEDLAAVRSDAEQLQAWAIDSVIRQLEEVFSDLFGLYVFGAAYLYAYEYFLAPGATARSARYPASRARVGFLLEAAKTLNISVDPKLFLRWQDPQRESAVDEEVLFFADQAVETTVPLVQAMAFDHLRAAGITPPDPLAIARIRASFEAHVPDGGGGSLAEIVCAGWDYLRQRDGLAADDQQSEYDMLNELMLKSIEVSEFLLRVNSNA